MAPRSPRSLSRHDVDLPTKPLAPTSTGYSLTLHPLSLHSATRSACGNWSCLPRSTSIFHTTPDVKSLAGGLLLICVMGSPCLRKWILHRLSIEFWLFASCRLFSSTSASFLSSWSCYHLSRPCVSAVLQPDRTCWSEALMVPQRSQDCSVPSH